VCGCRLSLKVHLGLESMRYRELDGLWPEQCWARPQQDASPNTSAADSL
jgi:hypothetical protein